MRRPGDTEPDPSGGRAAERLREFRKKRLPQDAPYPDPEEEMDKDEGPEKDRDAARRNKEKA